MLTSDQKKLLADANRQFEKEIDNSRIKRIVSEIVENLPIPQVHVNVPEIIVPEIKAPSVQVNVPDIHVPTPEVTVNVPKADPVEVKIPPIKVPKPEVTVNVPPIKIPPLVWPKENMPIEGWVQLQGVNINNPLPVQIRDAEGKPVSFNNLGGNSANAAHVVKVSGVLSTVAVVNVDPDGTPIVTTIGLTDTELRASHLDVQQLSGSIDSVRVTGFDTSVAATIIDSSGVGYSGSNPLPVTGTVTSTSGITGIADGRTVVTTAGTRVVLASSTSCKKVDITAETDNTGIIVVGGTTVVASLSTRRGVPLYAGDTYSIEIDDLNDVNLDSTVSGDGVTYTYYT